MPVKRYERITGWTQRLWTVLKGSKKLLNFSLAYSEKSNMSMSIVGTESAAHNTCGGDLLIKFLDTQFRQVAYRIHHAHREECTPPHSCCRTAKYSFETAEFHLFITAHTHLMHIVLKVLFICTPFFLKDKITSGGTISSKGSTITISSSICLSTFISLLDGTPLINAISS